jgi:hypothetical protein
MTRNSPDSQRMSIAPAALELSEYPERLPEDYLGYSGLFLSRSSVARIGAV